MPDFNVVFEWVSEVGSRFEVVLVASPDLFVGYVAGLLQFGNDTLGGPFGDSDPLGDVACSNSRVVGDRDQDSCMVRYEGPWLRLFVHAVVPRLDSSLYLMIFMSCLAYRVLFAQDYYWSCAGWAGMRASSLGRLTT